MAGILGADRIIESEKINQKIKSIGEEAAKIVVIFDQIAAAGAKINESLGKSSKLNDISNISKQAANNAKNIAIQQKALLDIQNRLTSAQSKYTKSIIDEQRAIQSKQRTANIEAQGRIKNAQLIAAEERATQASIRTKRLEQQQHTKTTSSFTRLAYSLRTYIAAYVSLQTIMGAVSSVFKQTKELDSLSFSMRTIIKDTNELAQTEIFLNEIAKNYGLNLLAISERYIRFRAATIQSNMTAKETQKIFDSVSKAASVLGLRTDEVAGIYLALEQMISKGKVTTEELRRQLGERLPGAFGIMAKTMQVLHPEMNVTLTSLDKMLRQGKIISAEVLPEFANQIEIALGIKSITKVDNLAAAQGRLNTSWTEFIKSLKASSAFASVFNILADSMQRINNAIKPDTNKVTERGVKLIGESVDKLNEATTVQERQEILTKQILDLEQKRGKISAQLVKDESKRPSFLEKTVSGLNQALGLGGEFTSAIMFEQVFQDTVLDEKAYKHAIDNLK
ncbi:MAG: tape measure protein, partial [Candidatus Gastranaerophilaceae bacterium]